MKLTLSCCPKLAFDQDVKATTTGIVRLKIITCLNMFLLYIMQVNKRLQNGELKSSTVHKRKNAFRGMHFVHKHLGTMRGTKCLDTDSHTEQEETQNGINSRVPITGEKNRFTINVISIC